MAEGKTAANLGGNIGAGAGFLAKRLQKSMNRAQEKVLQKLGKTMETKDEQFEQCAVNLNKQQADGSRLYKDVKAYYNSVKEMHDSSKRLSQTLRDIYESDWQGVEDLSAIMESEDLLWNDYDQKLSDQIVHTVENYISQFPEVKERVAKRGRKLVDYDSARHHLEALQCAKRKDEAKITKAEEEFNKAQSVFEDINKELREELPVLHQSRIGCYITVFQNISNLRDVFYKEMSVLNNEIYNVMKKLETQHSGKSFIIKGLNSSTKSKSRKSLTISAPMPCNTAFPPQPTQADVLATVTEKEIRTAQMQSEDPQCENVAKLKSTTTETSDCDEFSSSDSGMHIPEGQLLSEEVAQARVDDQITLDVTFDQSEDTEIQSQTGQSSRSDQDEEAQHQEAKPSHSDISMDTHSSNTARSGKFEPLLGADMSTSAIADHLSENIKEKVDQNTKEFHIGGIKNSHPPGFLYKAAALEAQDSDEGLLLEFEKGDMILIFSDAEEKPKGSVWGVREQDWIKYKDLTLLSGIVMETMIQHIALD